MKGNAELEIVALLDQLKVSLHVATVHSLTHTADLLKIAILDLQMILSAISDDELKAFAEMLECEVFARRQSQRA